MSEELIKRLLKQADKCFEGSMSAKLLREAADALSRPAPAVQVPEGLPLQQEPKYTTNGRAIVTRATGEAIPADEPVFIFRARDVHAREALEAYACVLTPGLHRDKVCERISDFSRFAAANPARMKQPDTAQVLLAAAPATVATEAVALPKGRNSFGLDMAYFGSKMGRIMRDIGSYKPDEFARECARMAATAYAAVLREPEFVAVAQDEPLTCDDCGAVTPDPWHSSKGDRRHYHRCDACHTKAVAQGGGVDVEKVMALVLQYGREKQAFGASGDVELGITADELRTEIRALLASPAVAVGDGWIPVGERLPENDTVCLVSLKDGSVTTVTYEQWCDGLAFTTYDGWSGTDNISDEVTHWQPLPAAPAIANQEARE